MAHLRKDKETNVIHIEIEGADIALCGLMPGWTNRDKPTKKKWECTCKECQSELEDLRKIIK